MLKKLSLLFIIICSVIFAGCANIEYAIVQTPSGEILQKLNVLLDSDSIESDGYTAENIAEDVEVAMRSYLLMLPEATGLIKTVERATNYSGDILVSAKLEFSSVSVYYDYYDIDPEQRADNYTTEKNFFTKKTIQTRTTEFSKINTFDYQTLFTGLESPVINYFTINDVTFTYSYATYSSKLKSDADSISYDYLQGIYVHSWDIPQDNLTLSIHFYSLSANTTGWYILGLGLTVLFMIYMYGRIHFDVKKEKLRLFYSENINTISKM
ncbi:MAG: hypothetical protein WC942_02040 [Clostridia bacterium]|jgi:hypothetical protein|nr:hypothetical protein [Clostridia bacterium]